MTLYVVYFLTSLCMFHTTLCDLPECTQKEIGFTYTECDAEEGRWRVQVPKSPNTCKIVNPIAPKRGKDCGFACPAGSYLDLETQYCEVCPPGTYSLGSGIRFDDWTNLPEGFMLNSESITFSQYGYLSKVNNCSSSLWKPSGQYIISNDDDCTSSLSYSVNLKKDGYVSFKYQLSDNNMMFHFYVQSSLCQTSHETRKNTFLNASGTGWESWKVSLDAGTHVLIWKTTGIMMGTRKQVNPAKLKEIEITGVSYTTECHKCRPGFHAPSNASHWCDVCPVNTISNTGAVSCTPCDKETQYSLQAASTCLERPACTDKDYFATHSPCDDSFMTKVMFEWIEPKVCLDTLDGSVKLPESGKKKACAPCNPGYSSSTNGCVACPKNFYSDGSSNCTQCMANTSPRYGFWYVWWDNLPSNMKTSCISFNKHCTTNQGWFPAGDEIQTRRSKAEDAYLILVLHVNGFYQSSGQWGKVTFAFQLECKGDCQFYFMKDQNTGTTVIESWRGSQPKQTYIHTNTDPTKVSYTWAFQQSRMGENDVARIYIVNVTNTVDGYADTCLPCSAEQANVEENCIPCPVGSFVETSTHSCKKCPENTILQEDRLGCKVCGNGTKSNLKQIQCESDCLYSSIINNHRYNFANLSTPKVAHSLPSFTSSGRRYNHVFKFNICNNQGIGVAECLQNISSVNSVLGKEHSHNVKAMVCQSTASDVLSNTGDKVNVHSKPTVVADILLEVTQTSLMNRSLPFETNQDLDDVIYHMVNSEDVPECPNGQHTYVYLRCDPTTLDFSGKIEMPSECPDGTCDGCSFHFLWKSLNACPICTEWDYDAIKGACTGGKQVTKYVWKKYPKRCTGGVQLPTKSEEPCRDIKMYIKLGSFVAIILLLILAFVSCRLWKKSKKLEYKYHRLVINSKSDQNGGELPAVDSCAISDTESDNDDGQSDEVIFQKKKSKFLGKKQPNYESVHLKPMTSGV